MRLINFAPTLTVGDKIILFVYRHGIQCIPCVITFYPNKLDDTSRFFYFFKPNQMLQSQYAISKSVRI